MEYVEGQALKEKLEEGPISIQEAIRIALERAFEERDPNLPYLGLDVRLSTLHSEPRFHEMLTRLNFPEEVLVKYLSNYPKSQ